MKYKYIYGPIPSRRLGVSLGIDPIPYKTCPLNCIYCECGATNKFTMERKEYIPTNDLLLELDHFITENSKPDYITFSGSGEPTLYSDIGKVITYLKMKYPEIKIAVLTNSVMLSDKTLQEELMMADLVAPSLDGISEEAFRKIDAPMKQIDTSKISLYLKEFAEKFLTQENKELWIEIFVVEGINNTDAEIERFLEVLKEIPYTMIQLNRLDRIGTNPNLTPAPMESLHYMKDRFLKGGLKNVEIIGKFRKRDEMLNYHQSLEDLILNTLSRRSLALEDIQSMSNTTLEEIGQYLDILTIEKKLITKIIDGRIIYRLHSAEISKM